MDSVPPEAEAVDVKDVVEAEVEAKAKCVR